MFTTHKQVVGHKEIDILPVFRLFHTLDHDATCVVAEAHTCEVEILGRGRLAIRTEHEIPVEIEIDTIAEESIHKWLG